LLKENLSKEEEIVYRIIKSYVKKKKPFNVKKLIPFIQSQISKSSSDLNQTGIKKVISSLLKKRLIVEGSILTKEEIIKQPKRKKIYDYIKKTKSTFYYDILKNLDYGSHIIIWHLNALLDFGYIKKARINNQDVYYPSELDVATAKQKYFLNNEKCQKILNFLELSNHKGATKTQIAKNLQMHPNTVKKYVKKLELTDVIIKKKRKSRQVYFLS